MESAQADGAFFPGRRFICRANTGQMPGQSVCIPPRTIHQFWGEEDTGFRIDGVGYTVSGEVSSVCDDLKDNFFFDNRTRFPPIDEDEPRRHYLCHEYPR